MAVCVFCKVDLSSKQGALCTVSVFFILLFTYLGVSTHQTPPAYEPVYSMHAGENTAAHRVYMYFRLEAKYGKKD